MPEGRVLHGCHQGVHVLRFVGDVRYPVAPALTALLGRVFAERDPSGFVIDLGEVTSIDSTNLGVIARLAVRVQQRCGWRPTVVAGSRDTRELLASMGIDGVCDVVDRAPAGTAPAREVAAGEPAAAAELARVMLDAHRALMELSRANQDRFRDVVAMLERDGGAS